MKRKNRPGMTLLEVIIAIALFALVVAPLVGVFSQGIRTERRSAIHALTTYEAQMRMEEAYGMSSDQLLADYNRSGIFHINNSGDEDDSIELRYLYNAVSDPGNPSDSNLYKVTITISNDSYVVETTLVAVLYAEPESAEPEP